ncbi:hypothetical protein PN498_25410 [Oscillatoria sp. CS-180]|uniref:hypothetical protein n=1 Tax=Oscillatoria sp. CS-180 TaxID=3021720 RepID=UPI00232BD151|nr:hypothetical protein [Oscillatoria sp. CS-180]MDB9529356.1 hypothetical protein [Oscillatoria sp. CS-180]
MKIESPNAKPLSSQEIAHLEILRAVVKKALEDGQFSIYEVEQIQSLIWEDGKVTYEELRTVNETIISVMGDNPPALEWRSYR